jgi:hypothetical protein
VVYVYGFVTVRQFMTWQNTSDILQTVEYQTKSYLIEFTRHCKHLPTFVLQLRVRLMKTSMGTKILFRWYNIIHVLLREKLQGALMFHKWEFWEDCMQRACTNIKCNYFRTDGFSQRLQFCNWLNGDGPLHHYIRATDESQTYRCSDHLTHNSHMCSD